MIVDALSLSMLTQVDAYCRAKGIGFISCSVFGIMSSAFVDLGPKFDVFDKDGEECKELFVGCITKVLLQCFTTQIVYRVIQQSLTACLLKSMNLTLAILYNLEKLQEWPHLILRFTRLRVNIQETDC